MSLTLLMRNFRKMKQSLILASILSILTLTGCTEANSFYGNCVVMGTEEQMEGWDESDRPSVRAGVEMGCKLFVEECQKNPEGETCIAVKKKYGKSYDA